MAGACGDGDSSPISPSGQGTLKVFLTDAPAVQVSQVHVFIAGLTVKRSESPVERIANETGLVDLLALAGRTQLLVSAGVTPGTYEFIQVDLDESQSSVVEDANGEPKPLKIPSTEIKVLGGFEVLDAGVTTLVLDFDAYQSLVQQGNGQWLLKPVIVMREVTTGSTSLPQSISQHP